VQLRTILGLTCGILLLGCESSRQPAADSAPSAAPSASVEKPAPAATSPAAETPPAAASAEGANAASPQEGKLVLERLSFSVPEGWQRKAPSSTFVLAEFALPKAAGDEADGRLTVSVAGGSIEANIDRWRDQFGGKPAKATEEKKDIRGLDVALVDFTGEFNDQRGPFAPATKRSGYRMLAAIIPVEGELHFVKAVGPEATMAAHAETFRAFIESVEKK
jgi:hypothetical protein